MPIIEDWIPNFVTKLNEKVIERDVLDSRRPKRYGNKIRRV